MGQYYKPTNIDKGEFVYSHDYDNGLKLMEHSYVGNNFMAVVLSMLIEGGRWFKNRIVWAGDYDDEGLFGFDKKLGSVYHMEDTNNFIQIKPDEDQATEKIKGIKYIINHDKSEYVKIPAYKKDAWIIHPLSLLTASGNGRGGGDYHGDDGMVGFWAGDRLSASSNKPSKEFTEIKTNFKEN